MWLGREGARLERGLQEDAGAVARTLAGLAQLLSSRHLELAKAFGQEEEIGYPELVGRACLRAACALACFPFSGVVGPFFKFLAC